MAVPLWAIALALQAASTAARRQQQKKIENRQSQLALAENQREAGRQTQRDAALNETLAGFDPPVQQQAIARAGTERADKYAQVQDAGVVPGEFAGSPSTPTEVRTEMGSRVADYLRRGRTETQARAKLGAFGDVQFDNQVNIGRNAQELDLLGDFTRGSQNALGFEMEGALNEGGNWAMLSDLLGAAGTGVSLYSMTAAPGAQNTTTAPLSGKMTTADLWGNRNAGTSPFYRR